VAVADIVTESASLTYSPGAQRWDFATATVSGSSINVAAKAVCKALGKLKATGNVNFQCRKIQYDNDSSISANNGDFYSVFIVSKCQ